MATIQSNDDFVNAINHLVSINHVAVQVQGARFLDAPARKVFDERGAGVENVIDITPDTPTLEAALDSALLELSASETKAVARTLLLSDAKNYLSNQLQSASPNVQTIFNTVKAYVDSNATLAQMLSNQIALFNTAYGVTVNPAGATAADRARYLICCQLVLATIA
jgi:hypothetical protein